MVVVTPLNVALAAYMHPPSAAPPTYTPTPLPQVLSCLAQNEERINSTACKKEVFYYLKMGVEDFRNDVALAEACRPDVDKLCADVEPGEGRIHACLQENREKLSPQCRCVRPCVPHGTCELWAAVWWGWSLLC